jgi:hypothetical protein
MFAVHARAPFFMVQSALALLRDGGRIVNISSGAGTRAMAAVPIYSMAKAAINNLTHRTRAARGHGERRGAGLGGKGRILTLRVMSSISAPQPLPQRARSGSTPTFAIVSASRPFSAGEARLGAP